jgi:hypothetical protein
MTISFYYSALLVAGSVRSTFGFLAEMVYRPGRAPFLLHDPTIIFLPLMVKFMPLVFNISNICDTGTFLEMRPM